MEEFGGKLVQLNDFETDYLTGTFISDVSNVLGEKEVEKPRSSEKVENLKVNFHFPAPQTHLHHT